MKTRFLIRKVSKNAVFVNSEYETMKSRPLCHHHGDYHTGNLIVNDGKLYVIDWHTMDFESYTEVVSVI